MPPYCRTWPVATSPASPMNALSDLITNFVYIVPPLALVLVWLGGRFDAAGRRQLVTGLWLVLAALSMLHYVWPHVRFQRYFNGYEHFHYYLGTKYADELGYTGLYVATVAALDENNADKGRPPIKIERARDLETGRHVSPERLRKKIPEVKERFTAERWAEYRVDAAFLAERASWGGMVKALDDKGYNASPAWTLAVGALASRASVPGGGIWFLPWVDVLLWLVAFSVVGRVFGIRPLAVMLVILGTQLVTDHSHLKAALLRVDWIVCLLLAMAAQKKQHPLLAGVLVGYASMMRIFPAVWGYGVGVKLVSELVRHRRIDKDSVLFLVGMAGSMLFLFGSSAAVYGLDYWREFFDKIIPHASAITAWRIGFRFIFVGLAGLDGWQEFYNSYSTVFYLICLAILIACAFVVEKLDRVDAFAFGFFAFFVLMAPTYYYYVAVLVPALWFGMKLQARWAQVGLTIFFVVAMLMHKLMAIYDRTSVVFIPMSVACLVMLIVVTVSLRREQRAVAPPSVEKPKATG